MTDRSAEDFALESDVACELETGMDALGDDRVETELDQFLDRLDEIDRGQRYFERYGTEHHHAYPMEPGELAPRSSSNSEIYEASWRTGPSCKAR